MKQRFLSFFLWVSQQKYAYFLLLPILFSIFMYGCKNESFTSIASPVDNSISEDGIISTSYEIETMSFRKFDDPISSLTGLEKISTRPIVDRREIKLNVFDDGSFEQTIRAMEPQVIIQAPIQTEIPPEQLPKTVLTKITRDGMAHCFDNNGKELRNFQTGKANIYNAFVTSLKVDSTLKNNLINFATGTMTVEQVDKLLDKAKSNGDNFADLQNGCVVITHTYNNNSAKGVSFRDDKEYKMELIVDKIKKVVLGSKLMDEQNRSVMEMTFKYAFNANNVPTLEQSHQETYDYKHPSKKVIHRVTESYFSNSTTKIKFK